MQGRSGGASRGGPLHFRWHAVSHALERGRGVDGRTRTTPLPPTKQGGMGRRMHAKASSGGAIGGKRVHAVNAAAARPPNPSPGDQRVSRWCSLREFVCVLAAGHACAGASASREEAQLPPRVRVFLRRCRSVTQP
jgi:hypothetical protein